MMMMIVLVMEVTTMMVVVAVMTMMVLVMEVLAVLEGHHCFLCFLLPFPALLPEAASSAGLSAAPVPKGCHQQRMPGAFLPLSSPFHRCNNHFVGTVAGAVLCVPSAQPCVSWHHGAPHVLQQQLPSSRTTTPRRVGPTDVPSASPQRASNAQPSTSLSP